MVLNIKLFRYNNPILDIIRNSVKNRYKDPSVVDQLVEANENRYKTKFSHENILCKINLVKARLALLAKKSKINSRIPRKPDNLEDNIDLFEFDELLFIKKYYEELEIDFKTKFSELENTVNSLLPTIGNILGPDVIVSNNENNNGTVHKFDPTPIPNFVFKYPHWELAKLDDSGSQIMGHRGYFLKGPLMFLQEALIQYALNFLLERDYQTMYVPFLMNRETMSKVAQLSEFHEDLYKVYEHDPTDPYSLNKINDVNTRYLIATSEQPLTAFNRDKLFHKNDFPIKYAGKSTCFRKEAGAAGKDSKGIFRVHQFEKIEQFVITTEEDSWNQFHIMINTAMDFYKSLNLPFRVVNIVSGALNNAASQKFDLEAWFHSYQQTDGTNGAYRELVSCSNCLDYQSINMNTRYVDSDQTKHVHMLNATLCATTRTLCCILENYQTDEGIVIPNVLQKYMPDKWNTLIKYNEII